MRLTEKRDLRGQVRDPKSMVMAQYLENGWR